ncbi:hypothetical protein HPG69_009993, partial [Diceros bicornis minor]
ELEWAWSQVVAERGVGSWGGSINLWAARRAGFRDDGVGLVGCWWVGSGLFRPAPGAWNSALATRERGRCAFRPPPPVLLSASPEPSLSSLPTARCLTYRTPRRLGDALTIWRSRRTERKSWQGRLHSLAMGRRLAFGRSRHPEFVCFPFCSQTSSDHRAHSHPFSSRLGPRAAVPVTGFQNQTRGPGKTPRLLT